MPVYFLTSSILVEAIGYTASILILISLIMSSTKKLRWINLFGSITFVVYAIINQTYPVAALNFFTAVANVYYLYKIYTSKSYFKILKFNKDNEYIHYFFDYNKSDIDQFYNLEKLSLNKAAYSFYILRDIMPVGVFIANKHDDKTLEVIFDYVIPSYRDFKAGKYIYGKNKDIFLNNGYTTLIAYSENPKHDNYLLKMGFVKDETNQRYVLNLND